MPVMGLIGIHGRIIRGDGFNARLIPPPPRSRAMDQLCRAALHRRAGAADRVGQVEILDRIGDRAPSAPCASSLGGAQPIVDEPVAAELPALSADHRGAELVEAVERQRLAEQVGQARGRSSSPRARRPAGTTAFSLRCTRPSSVDVGAVLFGIGRAGQDDVGGMRALVAMMADIDLEASSAKFVKSTSSAPSRNSSFGLGRGDVGDAARLAHSRASARPCAPPRCAATLKPFQPSRTRFSGSASASAAPSAPGTAARRRRRSPPAARRSSNASARALGSLPSSDRSSPSHSTL